MLNQEKTGLIIVDVQGKLARMVYESETLLNNIQTLVQGCQILNLPIVWLEQNPQGLGRTVPELSELLNGSQPLEKSTFDACRNKGFVDAISESSVQQWLVCGIESHICVYQTAMSLIKQNYEVQLVEDCVSSRTIQNKQLGINKLVSQGAQLTGLEMCLYELVKDCRKPEFKAILSLIK